MKTFQRLQKDLASLGYRRNGSPFNKTQLWIFVKVFVALTFQCVHVIYESNTIRLYVDSIFMIAATILILMSRVSTLFKNDAIYEFIDSIEKILNGSKLNFYLYLYIFIDAILSLSRVSKTHFGGPTLFVHQIWHPLCI